MKITLRIDGKEKTYQAPFVKARILKNYLKLQKDNNLDDIRDPETLDEIIGLMVEAYDGQFTIDEVWDGVESKKLTPLILEFIGDITGANEDSDDEGK